MSSIADLLAVNSEFEFEGEKFQLRKPILIEQAKFSQWLKDKSKEEAGRGDVPEEVREGLYRAVSRDCGGELYYEIDSPGYVIALQRPAGFARLLQIIFESHPQPDGSPGHPGITIEKVQSLLEYGLKEQFVKLLVADGLDPKVMAGVLAVLGFPPDYLSTSGNSSSDSATHPSTEPPSSSAG